MGRFRYFLDLFVVLVFAAMGRSSHDLSSGVMGVLETAWPFLAGMALGWLALQVVPSWARSWWAEGILMALCTVPVGMLLRLASGQGTALPFVLVASGFILAGFLVWRVIAAVIMARRSVSSPA